MESHRIFTPSVVIRRRYSQIFILLSVVTVLASYASADLQNKTTLTVGYLTAFNGELRDKEGVTVSGAITLALDEINNDPNLLPNVTLSLKWNNTRGDTVLATEAIMEMIDNGVVSLFGPEGPCYVEAVVSQSKNIPMFSYKCSDYMISSIPTFIRTDTHTQITKPVISLLHYYGWKEFSIIHEEQWTSVANALQLQAKIKRMKINHFEQITDSHQCCENNLPCCTSAYWHELIQSTKNKTRIYVFIGTPSVLVDLMNSMDEMKLFAKGQYMVIFADMTISSASHTSRYLWSPSQLSSVTSCATELEKIKTKARSLLVVTSRLPTENNDIFATNVRKYNTKEPFNLANPPLFNQYERMVSITAAHLYDSVKLYGWALDKLLRQETRPLTSDVIHDVASNGTEIVETIINKGTYESVTGLTIKIDHKGTSAGNFSLLAMKPLLFPLLENSTCDDPMIAIAYFQEGDTFPEYKIINASVRIEWPGLEKPSDIPINELCSKDGTNTSFMVVAGVLGLIIFCAGAITMSIYQKRKIKSESKGFSWKTDPREITKLKLSDSM